MIWQVVLAIWDICAAWVHQFRCHHNYTTAEWIVTGATLGWDMQPTRQFTQVEMCPYCSKRVVTEGMVVMGDKKLHPELYDESGWPLDEDGNRLEIVEDG